MAQMMMTSSNIVCEACNVDVHPKAYEQHVEGKKHKFNQEHYDRKYKTLFVTGINNFTPNDLQRLFKKYGQIINVHKHQSNQFAFIRYTDIESVERALKARIFAGGKRIFVRRYDEKKSKNYRPEDNKDKTRKLSETLSNTSQAEGEGSAGGGVGMKELPVQLANPDCCPEGQDKLLWQTQDFISQVEIPYEKYLNLNEVIRDVENLFTPLLPGCRVMVFGSCGSTLAFKTSDVDLFLQAANGEQPIDFVKKEGKEMYRSRLFRILARIPSARVPIIKFEHLRTGWQGDLTANSRLGVCNSQLIRFLISLDPRIKPLVMVIKYWAKVCEITGSHSRLTTYSLVMMVIFYLQQLEPPVLPTIAQLQQMSQNKEYCLGWECSFCDEEWRVHSECLPQPNNLSLRELLTGFFRFYHNFDFNNVICPLLGRSLAVKDFESDNGNDLPDEMFLYKEKLKSDPKCKFRTDVNFKVQDPFELCINVTRNVAERTCLVFKEACKVSLQLCDKEDDGALLKSLFTIDPESFSVSDENLKFIINFKGQIPESLQSSESTLDQWYELTTDAIMIVLKEILKFKVDPQCGEKLNKVKKLESSQDVHTLTTGNDGDKNVFVCSGNADVWNSRRKMSRFINGMKITLNAFEKEVCISNALYCPDEKDSFSFTIVISSVEELKKGEKGIEVKMTFKKVENPIVKRFIYFIKPEFKNFVQKACAFINKIKSSSPVTEVKESLKDLFRVTLENLPDLKELMDKRNELIMEKMKVNKFFDKLDDSVKSVSQDVNSAVGNIENQLESTPSDEDDKRKTSEEKVDHCIPTIEKQSTENIAECGLTKVILSPKNMPSEETQILIDEYFKPKSPSQIGVLKNSNESLENTEINKFEDLLKTIQKVETQSTFTSEETNPFLKSIEKVAFQSLDGKSQTNKQDETEIQYAECEEKSNNQGKEDQNPEGFQKITDIKIEDKVNEGEIHIAQDEGKVNCIDKSTYLNETLADSSQENSVRKEASCDKVTNEQRSDTKISLQRPKIHSERPLKQRKPNRYNKNTRQHKTPPYVGGGPPRC